MSDKVDVSSFIRRAQEKRSIAKDARISESLLLDYLKEQGFDTSSVRIEDTKSEVYRKVVDGMSDEEYWNLPIFQETKNNVTEFLNNITRRIEMDIYSDEIEAEEDVVDND